MNSDSGKTKFACFTSYREDAPVYADTLTYMVYQREKCPETGRLHWQGYAEAKSNKTYSAWKRALGDPSVHLEKRRGTPTEAANYCMKEDSRVEGTDYVEHGERSPDPHPGARTDLVAFAQAISDNVPGEDLVQNHLGCLAQYPRLEHRLKEAAGKKRSRPFRDLTVYIHWGETGTGKTRLAYEEGAFMWRPESPEWWCGYEGENIICIDEFYGQLKPARLLALLDGYQLKLPIKGGHVYAEWTIVYITSNVHPDDWWSDSIPDAVRAALKRRITEVIEFKKLS